MRKDREDTTDGRGGGILVYTKEALRCYEIDSPADIVQTASIQISLVDSSVDIHVVYRSPNSSSENNAKINDFIRNVKENSILVGDFNYPGINWELMSSNSAAQDFFDVVCDKFLTQHVDFPTHISGNTLDLVLTNVPNRILNVCEHGKLGNSDHVIICTDLETVIPPYLPKHVTWNYAKAKFADMRREIQTIPWDQLLSSDIEADWMQFKTLFLELCDKYVPKKTIRELNRPPWLKQEMLRIIRQKRAAWKKYRLSKNQEDFQSFKGLEKKLKKQSRMPSIDMKCRLQRTPRQTPSSFTNI